jgi:predicted nucleic acid-binding protein
MEVQTLVDAGPLIGWLNASDQWHSWSVSTLGKVKGPIHTSEVVLGEACWHLGGNTQPVHALLTLVSRGAIQLLHPWPDDLQRTQELMLKYPMMDAGDASLVVLSELHPKARIITTDRTDFSIYRRFRSQKLPAIFP